MSTFKEITPGAVFRAGPRSVIEFEIIEFARRYDPQFFHIDPVRAAASRWGGVIASGWMTCGIAMELAVREVLADSNSIGSPGCSGRSRCDPGTACHCASRCSKHVSPPRAPWA